MNLTVNETLNSKISFKTKNQRTVGLLFFQNHLKDNIFVTTPNNSQTMRSSRNIFITQKCKNIARNFVERLEIVLGENGIGAKQT